MFDVILWFLFSSLSFGFGLQNIGSLGCDDERKDQSNDETFEDENDSFGTETSCCNGENKLCGCHFCLLSPPYMQSVDETDIETVTSKRWSIMWNGRVVLESITNPNFHSTLSLLKFSVCC